MYRVVGQNLQKTQTTESTETTETTESTETVQPLPKSGDKLETIVEE